MSLYTLMINNTPFFRTRIYGDAAIVIDIGESPVHSISISEEDQSRQVIFWALQDHLAQRLPSGVTDLVLGQENLTIVFEPLQIDLAVISIWLNRELQNFRTLNAGINERLHPQSSGDGAKKRGAEHEHQSGHLRKHHVFDACFGGASGPDLDSLAKARKMSEKKFIELLCSNEYHVQFLGFQPGFPYMSGLSRELFASRLNEPRAMVAAGSIAIGHNRLGIYPQASPGGWRIIGKIDHKHLPLADFTKDPPARLRPGDRVTFRVST